MQTPLSDTSARGSPPSALPQSEEEEEAEGWGDEGAERRDSASEPEEGYDSYVDPGAFAAFRSAPPRIQYETKMVTLAELAACMTFAAAVYQSNPRASASRVAMEWEELDADTRDDWVPDDPSIALAGDARWVPFK